ncbi:MAG: radical SAM protein [Elusimicrobia bacterium HGW-Elusimicrobia-1]|nr:MAG: radical SAM protein [Elusimicrobia bacterium HGW-Elusimicrobia-1]
MIETCRFCGHSCGADRSSHTKGTFCGAGPDIEVSCVNLHFGEEPPISGTRGSGTIFFAHCSLSCVFCQNYPISAFGNGRIFSVERLAAEMTGLAALGAHNINLVSPTHYAAPVAKAIILARKNGLAIPVVYNTGGYDGPDALRMFDGLVDVYMPDAKYASGETALKYSGAADYPDVNRAAIKEMFRQTGHLKLSADGIAVKGVLIRHLVLPGHTRDSKRVLDNIAEDHSTETQISIMSQYHPAHKASDYPELSTKLSRREYADVVDHADKLGFANAYIQYLQ